MFRLLPILATLPLVLAVEQPINPSSLAQHESGFSKVIRSNQHYQRKERRAGGGGIESMVTDLLGGGDNTAQPTGTGTSRAVSTRERGAGRGSSVASEQTAQVGATFQTTALATPTTSLESSAAPPLSTSTAPVSSPVVDTGSSPIPSNPSSSSSPLSEQTLSSATGVVTSALLTSPSPSSASSALSMSTSTLLSSSPSETASSTTVETSSESEETTISVETQAPNTPTQVFTQQAVSTAEAVTILSTLSDNGGGVVTIYSTAGQQNTVPSSSSLNTNSATSLSIREGLAMSSVLVISTIGFLL